MTLSYSPPRPRPAALRVRRAAVVGADGFIGRHLAAALPALHMASTGYGRQHELLGGPGVREADVVFYLASSVTPALAEEHPDWATADHLRFAALLAELSRLPKPPTVVLTSSGGTVYDPGRPPPYHEDSPTRATSRYGAAKLALEDLLARYAGRMPGVILRLSNVYGPGQRTDKSQGVLAHWLSAAARGEPLRLIGDPAATRDYVYVHDVVACLCRVAARTDLTPGRPLVLNVGSGESTSLGELFETVQSVVGRELTPQRRPHRAVDRLHTCLDVGRAARVLGWRPTTGLREGVAVMWGALDRTTTFA